MLRNNQHMGMVRQWQALVHGERDSHSYMEALPDFSALARAFGWQSARVICRSQLDAAFQSCLDSSDPYFLAVLVAPEAHCFPMIAAGRGHQELMLGPGRHYLG